MTKIRTATSEDKNTLASFQLLMARETEDLNLEREVLLKGIQALLDDPSKGRYFVAEEHDEILGCLMVTPEWSDWRNGTVWWIQSVFIMEEHRNKGIYKKLYNFIQEEVKKDDSLKGIRLYVDKTNLPAQAVYEALGMDGSHYQLYEWMK